MYKFVYHLSHSRLVIEKNAGGAEDNIRQIGLFVILVICILPFNRFSEQN